MQNSHKLYPECTFKVSIIGAGNVGATAAYAMLLDGTPTHISLIDVRKELAEGIILDMYHSLSFVPSTKLTASDKIEEVEGSHLVVITAGAKQKEGQTRLDLIATNRKILETIIPKAVKAAKNAIILVVSNPVDVLTQIALNISGLPKERVFGSGTMLDTARFRYHLSKAAKVNPKSVEAYILGEHGDSSFLHLSSAEIAGIPLFKWPGINEKVVNKVFEDTQKAAYRIIHDIGYTCYSIATVIKEIMVNIFTDSHAVLPLSTLLSSHYTSKKVCLSVPCVIGRQGILKQLNLSMSKKEEKSLENSIKVVSKLL